MKERTAIVTGAAKGLGRAMALALAEAGASIVCADLQADGAKETAQAIGRQMIKQKKGKIINIASISGFVVNRLTNRHPLSYFVSKAGIIMLTKVLAAEWAQYNITVNAIALAYMKTDIINPDPKIQAEMVYNIPMGRLGEANDLNGAVVYLASNESDFITGHVLTVDGGYTVW